MLIVMLLWMVHSFITAHTQTDVEVYIATKMTGRDRHEMVSRAAYVCDRLKAHGVTPISPIIEEKVDDHKGSLHVNSKERLRIFWRRDKDIIRYKAHVVLIDGAEAKSFGVEREYALNRWCLWKPTVLLLSEHHVSVADFEDDYITNNLDNAAQLILEKWGSRQKRWQWRIDLLKRTLPNWLKDQVYAWR